MAVGVKASTSLSSLERAMVAIFDGSCTKEYILELVAEETSGKSRSEKVNRTIRRMTVNNPLLPFIKEHSDEFMAGIRNNNSRTVIYTALMCAAYPLFYDTVSLLGKLFHAQDEVPMNLVYRKLSEKYGASVDYGIAYNSTIKMLFEAGLIKRPTPGIYEASRVSKASDFALELYRKSFVVNNPNYTEADDIISGPYFEFINN